LRFYDHSDSRVNGNLDETAKKVCGALRRPPYIPALKDGGLRRTGLRQRIPHFLHFCKKRIIGCAVKPRHSWRGYKAAFLSTRKLANTLSICF